MNRLGLLATTFVALGWGFAALAVACGGDEESSAGPGSTTTNDGGPSSSDGDIPADGGTEDGSPDVDGGGDAGSAPVTVLATTDDVRDIAVLKGTLYLLFGSSVETCSAELCATSPRVSRVPAPYMPPELAPGNGPAFYENRRILVIPLATGEGILIAQNGNAPCALDCIASPPQNPAIYNVSGTKAADILYAMSFPEFTKGANVSTVDGIRHGTLWYDNRRNNEALGKNSKVVLAFGPNAGNDAFEVKTVRDDTRGVLNPSPGSLLAGGHGSGDLYVTRVGSPTELYAANPASLNDNSSDTSANVQNATFLTTTANLRFTKTAATSASQLLRGVRATAQNNVVNIPGLTDAHVVVGTELGLVWYVPRSEADLDAGLGGPLTLSFCSESALTLGTCAPASITVDMDEITRIVDEAPYLYAFGRKGNQKVVVRFAPP